MPGIRRVGSSKHVRYVRPNGRPVSAPAELARIKALVIPPAWTDVWICPNPARSPAGDRARCARPQAIPLSHAIPPDARRGEVRAAAGLRAGAAADPPAHRGRRAQARPAAREGARRRGSAAREDADSHRQRGIRARQRLGRADDDARPAREDSRRGACASSSAARAASPTSSISTTPGWRGSSRPAAICPGTSCSSTSTSRATARRSAPTTSTTTCAQISGDDFTAKDFRTWAGTVLAAQALARLARFKSQTEAKRNVVEAIACVAKRLGNTKVGLPQVLHPSRDSRRLHGRQADGERRGAASRR